MSDNDPRTNHGAALLMIAELNRKLARFEQAELPGELLYFHIEYRHPDWLKIFKDGFSCPATQQEVEMWTRIDALRAYAAKVTVERDEAKERAEKAEKSQRLAEFSWAGCAQQLKDAIADLEAAERRAEELTKELKIQDNANEILTRRADENARDAERLLAMAQNGWYIGWNREGEHCRVFHSVEEDGWVPICGWEVFFDDWRNAIDAARNEEGKK